jgi:ethanolamine transporter EutH
MILIPMLFGLGVPLVNIDRPLKQKLQLTLVVVLVSIVIFIATVLAVISFDFGKYLFPGLLVGLAGVVILGINGLLIETISFNLKTISLTFLLSGLTLPIWVLLTENVFPKTFTNVEMVRQYGVMLFWMTMTTIGICYSIKKDLTINNFQRV